VKNAQWYSTCKLCRFMKFCLNLVAAVLLCTSALAQGSKTVRLTTAGTLKDNFTATEKATVAKLTVTGYIDARDVAFMRDSMPVLAELDLEGASVVAYEGTAGTFPDSISYSANEMPSNSFYYYPLGPAKTSLVLVKLPAGLTSIGGWALAECVGLTSLSLPAGVTSVGNHAIYYCTGLTNLSLPAGLTSMGFGVFAGCRELTSITNHSLRPQVIQNDVVSSINRALCTLTVPTSSLGLYADAEVWKDFTSIAGGGILFDAKANNPALGSLSSTAQGLYASGTAISLRATPAAGYDFLYWAGQSGAQVSTSPTLSFTLTQDSVLTAHFGKVQTLNLTAAGTLKDMPAGIKIVTQLIVTGSIDARDVQFMRDSMPGLVELDLAGASVLAYSGTAGTYPDYISYPANEMPQYSFYNYASSFAKTSLGSVKLPASLTNIGEEAFYYCSGLTSLRWPAGLTRIGERAFAYCSGLTGGLSLPAGVTSIGDDAFYACYGLTNLSLPAGLTSIGEGAFFYCRGLTSLSMPAGLTSIGEWAFAGCTGLTAIYNMNPTPLSIPADVFYGVPTGNVSLYVISSSAAEAYSTADVWREFKQVLVFTPATGIALDKTAATSLQAYPNPVVNEELIVNNEELRAGERIEVYALGGGLVKTFAAIGTKSVINLSALPAGVYVVRAGNRVAKVVKK
jgi:hypothetical protein